MTVCSLFFAAGVYFPNQSHQPLKNSTIEWLEEVLIQTACTEVT